MTEQIEFAIEQNPTRWQKLLAWLNRFDEGMNPLVHTAALVRDLGGQVTRLDSRVIELERRSRRSG